MNAAHTTGHPDNLHAQQTLQKRLEKLDHMPTIPAAIAPLLRYLDQPADQLDLQQVVELISQDESLAAKCLGLSNSPLFGRKEVDSVRGAIVALGLQRVRDIAVSCSLLTLVPTHKGHSDPIVFWEHSLGCALVCREFARMIGYSDPGKAYLAGLLHDVGIVAHLWAVPREFYALIESAQKEGIPLHEAEQASFGTNHCHTGKLVAERWRLTTDLLSVISCHHDVAEAKEHRDLVALVSLSDLLCRMSGLGYGYAETRIVNFCEEPGFQLLEVECPKLKSFDWARFTFELEAYMEEVHRLVAAFYRK